MLNQTAFEQRHKPDWDKLEEALKSLESSRLRRRGKAVSRELPTLYAALCQQHALALSRGYSHALTNHLHELIVRAHHQLYKHKGHFLARSAQFLGGGFARALRREWRLFAISCVLFFGTAIICGLLAASSQDFADMFMGGKNRSNLEQMYKPSDQPLRPAGMESATNLYMFGFYINNNISIDFRVFAGGILFGIGTVFFTVFNGVFIGAASGHLTSIGYGEKFWSFVAGHSAPELIALCISATAGLMLARALIKPGRQTRRLALTREAKQAVPIIVGAGLMTLLAAFIEAYWSSMQHPLSVKLSVGAAIWALIICYLVFSGRHGRY